jgi:hypothetical protein
MRFQLYSAVVFLLVGTCAGQTFFPKKDLTFGQVAVGISIETEITVTNTSVFTYEGTLFFRMGEGEIWNPIVDGPKLMGLVTGGKRQIQLQPGETKTFRVRAPSGVVLQSGTIMLWSHEIVLDNFIEGNLTYYFKDSGKVFDSVGLGSSGEFYFATVPFEDFSSIGLALVNGNVDLVETVDGLDIVPRPTAPDADVLLRLYRDTGEFVAFSTDDSLTGMKAMTHTAKLLPHFFPGVQLGRGKVEIISNVTIYGTALTFLTLESGTQSSSLPLEPSPIAYTIQMTSDNEDILIGDMTLWAEGYFVKGYLIVYMVNGTEITGPGLTLVNGQLVDGIMELSFYAQGEGFEVLDSEVSLSMSILSGFSFLPGSDSFVGPWAMTSLIDPGATLAGNFVLTKIE